ncbi:HlyD family secretion protein [Roseimaritima multifibrata]|uniref:HlyD family secretion protein n=1 Tax=Roseimaritima multifibrata TaxID=1930274 RepID=A0A517MM38_9BACT|nr:HlyD family efflux transporter periplasmic adaptor subunit [Roseimaritima multifibrata]QDS95955.1 HlyD family secretion protein [Roseimaritima multifibrata]
MNDNSVDISQLALDRTVPDSAPSRGRKWGLRYGIPLAILAGFLILLGAAAGKQWMPRQEVTVLPVLVKRGEVQQTGTPLFQAPGWIEPRPIASSVAALAPGVIDELLVVEGELIEKNQPIARLISIDSELAVEQAEAKKAIREGELARAKAERDAAKIRLHRPAHLQADVADAESQLAKAKTELAKLPFLIAAAEGDLQYAEKTWEGRRDAEGAIAGRLVQQAANAYATAQAIRDELLQREPYLQREIQALENKLKAARERLTLLVEEKRQLEEAEAKVSTSAALLRESVLLLRQANLAMDRSVVRAPMNGRVLRLIASPGSRVMGMDANAGQNSSTVIEMYDPNRLQVRADVRLEDVPMVTRGQGVEVKTASSAAVILGRVLQVTSTASVQKNTLEVKVELLEPPENVRPEMLVTATFLAPESPGGDQGSAEIERLFVPESLLAARDADNGFWVVDEKDQAAFRTVESGQTGADGLMEVVSGLRLTDKLIVSGRDGLKPGMPLTVLGEDRALGFK